MPKYCLILQLLCLSFIASNSNNNSSILEIWTFLNIACKVRYHSDQLFTSHAFENNRSLFIMIFFTGKWNYSVFKKKSEYSKNWDLYLLYKKMHLFTHLKFTLTLISVLNIQIWCVLWIFCINYYTFLLIFWRTCPPY